MYKFFVVALFIFFASPKYVCQTVHMKQTENHGNFSFALEQHSSSGVSIIFSTEENILKEVVINDVTKTIFSPEEFSTDNTGALNFPGSGRFIAVPKGATASVSIISTKKETYQNIDISYPAPIPLTVDNDPVKHPKKYDVYHKDIFYPENPVKLSAPTQIRGVDVVILQVTPYQYNSTTKELHVYRELKIEVTFSGGNGHIGEDCLRNRWWDQVLQYVLLNYESLPEIEYKSVSDSTNEDFEFIIITPDNPDYITWADSLRLFRTLQGINTGVVTLSDIGGNDATLIENYIDNAYNTWAIPPVAVLLLADYGEGSATGNGIIAPVYNNYCVSDHIYADVNGNNMADIILARITAQNNTDLESMINKILNYERTPPNISNFYNNPLCVSGWQPSGVSVLCAEVIFGFWENVLDKQPIRQYSGYSGGAPSNWPTDPYSTSLVAMFGPGGLGYIPPTPAHLTNWNGSAAGINNAINSGTFAVHYRGHGSMNGWSEPSYLISDLSGLNNIYPPFVFSINCLSGKFNSSSDSFAEAFHKHPNGALGIIAASEVTYSFVTSDYVWGLYDYLWPEFFPELPPYPPYRGVLPAFANVAAKYFLQQNNSPYYNQQAKEVTYHLFHHFGDAFSMLYTEFPQNLSVYHDSVLIPWQTTFTVSADEGSLICLTVSGNIIGIGTGTGAPLDITIQPQPAEDTMLVTVTKQNYYRYSRTVLIDVPSNSEEDDSFIIKSYTLFQNYPNPFNPSTTIKYQIPKLSFITIKVYDVLGSKVATLVNEEKPIGRYEITWYANNLPNGIYFYRLQSGNFVSVKKMILMK